MKRIVSFPLENGDFVLVEIDESKAGTGLKQVGKRSTKDGIYSQATITFEKALEKIKPIANTLITKFRSLTDTPEQIEVEFGLSLSAEYGIVLTAASLEANYKVTLTWKKDEETRHAKN